MVATGPELATAYVSISASTGGLGRDIAKALGGPEVSRAGDAAGKTISSRIGGAMKGIGAGLLAAGGVGAGIIGAAGVIGVKTAAQLESTKIAFTTMLGSGKKAQKFLNELASFAAKTPFEMPDLQTAAQSLVSIGVKSKDVIPIMTTLGDVTAGMGTGAEGIKRATVAIQQMNAAGKIQAEDLNQLRDAGIPVYDLLSSALGKTKAQVASMVQGGKLGRKELGLLMDALKTGKGLERFSGMMDKQSQSLAGLWSTLKDTATMGLAKAIQPLVPLIKQGLGGGISLVTKLMPVFADGLTSAVHGAKGLFEQAKRLVGPLGEGGGLTGLLQTMKPYLTTVAHVALDLGTALFKVGSFVAKNVLPPVLKLAAAAYKQLEPGLRAAEKVIRTQVIPALDQFLTAIKPIIAWLFKRLLPIVKVVFHVIGVVIKDAMKIVGHIIGLATDLITGDWSGAWGHIKGIFSAVWDAIKTILRGALKIVKQLLGAAWDVVKAVSKRAWTGVKDLIGAAWDKIKSTTLGAVRWVVNRFLDFAGGILNAAAKAFSWVPGIGPKLKSAADKFADFRDSVNAKLGGIKDQHVDITTRYRINGPSANQQAAKLGDIMAARGMATGGTVMGARAPYGDKVLTHLAPGEEVISNRNGQADRFRPLLKAINAGKIRGLADGGTVFDIRPRGLRGSEAKFESLAEDVGGITSRLAGSLAAALKAVVARLGIGGPHFGGSWHKLWDLVQPMGAILTSAYRPGARTQFGNLSRHAMGKAIDIAPNRAIFEKLYAMRGRFYELLTPWGMWLKGHPYFNAGVQAIHRNHMHISSYADGGTVKPFVADSGVTLAPGINVLNNKLGKPEPLARTDQPMLPRKLALVVDGHEFTAYVEERADVRIARRDRRVQGAVS